MNIFNTFPSQSSLIEGYRNSADKPVYKVNGHIHTPYSFSSFDGIEQAFEMAVDEKIAVLGINDFFVADGYQSFYENAIKNKIFPLFNIEFIGLIKEAQEKNIRINDPNNPGRIYFTGKGLSFPFSLEEPYNSMLSEVIVESQNQVKAMIESANQWFMQNEIDVELDFVQIKQDMAKELVRERHIAKAIRQAVFSKYIADTDKVQVFERMFGGKTLKSNLADIPALENEIRGNLLKSGGKAFVEETEKSFLDLGLLIKIIIRAGGIPCYPVLLDDNNGNITEFEGDFQKLHDELQKHQVSCIELIPGRNDFNMLKDFVRFFNNKGFVVLFGTEHNTPDRPPLTVFARNNTPLDDELSTISFENSCVVAAHQYLVANGSEGYISASGNAKMNEKESFIELGKAVIQYFLDAK